jgi:hypothetical protein
MGDTLVIGLAEMNVPGHTAFAMFRPDGDQTLVTILFGHDCPRYPHHKERRITTRTRWARGAKCMI